MLNEILSWTQIASYLLLSLVMMRKYRSTKDQGILWLGLGFFVAVFVVVIPQAWVTLVFWARSPHVAQINAAFESLRTTMQILALTIGIYMVRGKPERGNFFKWLFEEDNQSDSLNAPHSA
jgi:hypothetical protein